MPFDSMPCRYCETPFTPERRHQVFCKPICRKLWWDRHWKEEDHKCPQCGTPHSPPPKKEDLKEYLDQVMTNA